MRKSKTSFIFNTNLEIKNDEPNITNTNDIRDKFKTWFQNKKINKSELNTKSNSKNNEKDNENKIYLKKEKSRIKKKSV